MPETGQWNSGDNEDPGVNSDDEEDVPQVMLNVIETPTSNISIVAD